MSDPAPWQCPACSAWLAPHVSEHRCDPPDSGVTAAPFTPSGTGGTSGALMPPGTTITVTASGSAVSERALLGRLQRMQLDQAHRNWSGPGRAA
jgi:hypothetical protein